MSEVEDATSIEQSSSGYSTSTSNSSTTLDESGSYDDLPDIVDTEPTATPANTPTQPWSEASEKLILSLYQQIEDKKIPTKGKWKVICNKMQEKGYYYTSEQCRLKVKALKERHLKLQRNKSGEGAPEDKLEDFMENIFSGQADVHPEIVLDSENKEDQNTPAAAASDTFSDSTPELPKAKRRRSGVQEMMDYLQEQDKAAERRHHERLDLVKELISVFKSK
ncbi:uncharacterized protein LOC117336194 [Pecten maximus]|uniref:uncharacterized protein LOC117336194 n=1 Tax=Pecten maximus TaxID=6579 RepID=UPI0014585A88|nr:uncharacterized protein LOC117336194 [Pecten maximus]